MADELAKLESRIQSINDEKNAFKSRAIRSSSKEHSALIEELK